MQLKNEEIAYRSASLVVVEIHLLPQISPPLAGINELPGEFESIPDVI